MNPENAIERGIATLATWLGTALRYTIWLVVVGIYRGMLRRHPDLKLQAMLRPFRLAIVCWLLIGTGVFPFNTLPGAALALVIFASLVAMLVTIERGMGAME
jgi:hypothetical protein